MKRHEVGSDASQLRNPPRQKDGPLSGARKAAAIWEDVRDSLAADIERGEYRVGDRLPSEHALATRFGVNRHTVRRALAALSEEGGVEMRHGAGAIVAAGKIDYPIGARTRFRDNIEALGMEARQRFLRIETGPVDAAIRQLLDLPEGAQAHVAEFVGAADGMPVVYGTQFLPAARLPDFPEALAATQSVAAALEACGHGDTRRKWTRLSATPPSPLIARHLRMMPNQPAMVSRNLSLDRDQIPIGYCVSWFCAARVEVVIV